MSEAPAPALKKRPVIITVICILGCLGLLFIIPIIFSGYASQIAPWYPAFLGFSVILGIISLIGFWMMRVWGLYLYCLNFVIGEIVLAVTGLWTIGSLIWPLVIVIIGFSYRGRMR